MLRNIKDDVDAIRISMPHHEQLGAVRLAMLYVSKDIQERLDAVNEGEYDGFIKEPPAE